jgi:hypothetical protein
MAFPVEQNIPLDARGYAISKDDSALTEEDVYDLANRYRPFVSDNLAYIDLLTEFAHTTSSTVALAGRGRPVDHVGGPGPVRHRFPGGRARAGIVGPPGLTAWSEAADYAGPDPEAWRASATKHRGSWREDRTTWPGPRAGRTRKAPSCGLRAARGHRGCHGRVRARLFQIRQTDSIGGTPWVT